MPVREKIINMPNLMRTSENNLRRLSRFLKMDDNASVQEMIFRLDLFIGWNPIPKPVEMTEEEIKRRQEEYEEIFI